MNIQEGWEKAVKKTEIIRHRISPLSTYSTTQLPYIFLAKSAVNRGDTVVRRGQINVEKPSIILPFNLPQFEGFEFEEQMEINEDLLQTFFLVRGIQFPSFRYDNKNSSLDVYEGSLSRAIEHYGNELARSENVHTGLISGPEECWQFSVLLFVGAQATKSAEGDIKRLFGDFGHAGLS